MDMGDLLWPWGALRTARETIARRDREIGHLERTLNRYIVTQLQQSKLLREAHFRNPKTGRIGKKGERHDIGQ
jgi:hypothetical protein